MTPGPIPKRCGADPPKRSIPSYRPAAGVLWTPAAPRFGPPSGSVRSGTGGCSPGRFFQKSVFGRVSGAFSESVRRPPAPPPAPPRIPLSCRSLPVSGAGGFLRPPSAITQASPLPPSRSAGGFFVSFPRCPRKSAFCSAFFAGFREKSPKSRLIFLPAMLYSRKAAPRQREARRRPAASGGRKGRVTGCFARNTRI